VFRDPQNVQLSLIQTHVSQSWPSEYAGKNDKDQCETSEEDHLGFGGLLSLGVHVAMEAGVAGKMDGDESPNRTQGSGWVIFRNVLYEWESI